MPITESTPEIVRRALYNAVARAEKPLTRAQWSRSAASEFQNRRPGRKLIYSLQQMLIDEKKIGCLPATDERFYVAATPERSRDGWGIDGAIVPPKLGPPVESYDPVTRAARREEIMMRALERGGEPLTRRDWVALGSGGTTEQRMEAIRLLVAAGRVRQSGLGVRGCPFRYEVAAG